MVRIPNLHCAIFALHLSLGTGFRTENFEHSVRDVEAPSPRERRTFLFVLAAENRDNNGPSPCSVVRLRGFTAFGLETISTWSTEGEQCRDSSSDHRYSCSSPDLLMWSQSVLAQDRPFAATAEKVSQEPASKAVIFTTPQDHQNMLEQLGITSLRPGRNARPKRRRIPPITTQKPAPTRILTCQTS